MLGATLLWAVETVIAKRLLSGVSPATLALVRMGGGAVVLLGYLAVTGQFHGLVGLGLGGLGWALVTGCLLGGYVGTWMTALSRARAIDVTSVLVASAAVTLALNALVHHTGLAANTGVATDVIGVVLLLGALTYGQTVSVGLLAAGVAAVVRSWPRVTRA